MKIQILIETDDQTNMMNITATPPEVPTPIALAIVTTAYHELLSKKFRQDLDASIRVAQSMPAEPRRFRG